MISELLQLINEAEQIIEHHNKLNEEFETKLNDVFVELLEIQHKLTENNSSHEDNFHSGETDT